MSLLKFFNITLFQWFFVRRARVMEDGVQVGWTWLKGVYPLTGWGSDYKYLRRSK